MAEMLANMRTCPRTPPANSRISFSPIPGTQLLYMANSSSDIFMDVGAQTYYVLISGRWFSAKALAERARLKTSIGNIFFIIFF